MTTRTSAVLAAVVSLLLLAACEDGGNGDGGDPSISMPPATPTAPGTVAEFRDTARSSVYGKISGAQVTFGSVAIATGARISRIDSTFSTSRATATLRRGAASPIQLDSADAWYDSGVETSVVDLPNRRSRTRYTFDHTAGNATLALLSVDWSNSDTSDYLAGGYWLHVEANPFSLQGGAFVDGPELELSNPPAIPVSGAASYQGSAGGMYALRYGSDGGTVPAGSEELGEFAGIATLAADFGAGTIGGCVGCVGDILLSGVYHDSQTSQVSTFEDVPTGYQVNLGTVAFSRSAGTFQGSNVTLTHPLAPGTRSSGTWAGQFSNRPNGAGDPRVVAGIFGGEGSTPGGSRAVFLGAFAAGSR